MRFWLDPAQAACLADDTASSFLAGGMAVVSSMHRDEDAVREAFVSGAGVGWHQHHHDLFVGTERFFRPGYAANLTSTWIPSIDGLADALRAGIRVADVGCGFGASTILMAQAYPNSEFTGYDYHPESVDSARQRAAEAGVGERVTFDVASATEFPGSGYGLVCVFDALHDMGDPTAAARHIRRSIAGDGVFLVVEPNAQDQVEGNFNLPGRVFYSASTFVCTPASRAQGGSDAACLGAQAGEAKLTAVLNEAGFTRVRRATETPFNMVLEAPIEHAERAHDGRTKLWSFRSPKRASSAALVLPVGRWSLRRKDRPMQKALAEVFTWPVETAQLIGSRCDDCSAATFPSYPRCPRCGRPRDPQPYVRRLRGQYKLGGHRGGRGTDRRRSRAAHEEAGIGPEDVDVIQIQDTDAGAEVIHMAENGFCADGDQERLLADGATEIGGPMPINTDGGLIGYAQVYGAPGTAAVTILSR